MAAPILVTGLPRSGTSLLAGCLAICGAWTGPTAGPSPSNRKGSFENEALKDRFVKPTLALVGADPLGLDPLPPVAARPPIEATPFRDLVERELRRQGWDGARAWLFKDAKLALIWPLWAAAFPEARWVVTHRHLLDVALSAVRAEPMARRLGYDVERWTRWARDYRMRLQSVPARHALSIDRGVFADRTGLESLVGSLGLAWRPREVDSFVSAPLWTPCDGARDEAA